MNKIIKIILPIVAIVSMLGMACPQAVASDGATDCDQMIAIVHQEAAEIEFDANVNLKLNVTIQHCHRLDPPYDDLGVVLFTSKVSVDGVHTGEDGILMKFAKSRGKWVSGNISQYYHLDAKGGLLQE
jgi:hypothetical protein